MSLDPRRILYEDEALLVVHKLPRELVVRGKGELQKLPLLDFLRKTHPTLQAIHRLDFETSGIVAFAKKPAVLNAVISSNFAGWRKIYNALVVGRVPKKGEITIPLPSRSGGGNVPSKSRFQLIELLPELSHVEVEISSGRHHQIRKHFAMIHHPLVCDDVYGDKKANKRFARAFKLRDFFLHAGRLVFPHPETGKEIDIHDPLPPAFARVLKQLKNL